MCTCLSAATARRPSSDMVSMVMKLFRCLRNRPTDLSIAVLVKYRLSSGTESVVEPSNDEAVSHT